MFDKDDVSAGQATALPTALLAWTAAALRRLDASVSDTERIEQIRLLEELKAAAAAAQAVVAAAFAASQEAAQHAAGSKPADVGKGVAAQVALARRESPARARRYLGWASVLVAELPHTHAALADGEVSEWRAMLVARETAWLSRDHRCTVDQTLAGQLGDLGDREVEARVREMAYTLDPQGYVARSSKVEGDRRVTLRPAPETMSFLTAHLPVGQGVAAYAALVARADAVRAAGDERSRGQIMADTLVEQITGQTTADAVPVEVRLVMTDQTLIGGAGSQTPAEVEGYGRSPLPWPGAWCTPHPSSRHGCAACGRTHGPASWSPWKRGVGASTVASVTSWSLATGSVAPPGATHRSATSTTSSPPRPVVPPMRPTGRGCARHATTPNRRLLARQTLTQRRRRW